MRAYHMIELLAARYRIYLLIISREICGKENIAPPGLSALCQDIAGVPIAPLRDFQMLVQVRIFEFSPLIFHLLFSPDGSPYLTAKMQKKLGALFPGVAFDLIHVFRLSMYPFAACLIKNGFSGTLQMDLDDIESVTARRLSRLHRMNGNRKSAASTGYEAGHYRLIEKRVLPAVDRVFVCSEIDKEKITSEYNLGNVQIIPNTINVPIESARKPPDGIFTFLFVGSLGYYPNHDGIIYFCKCILPLMQRNDHPDFLVRIVGTGATGALRKELADIPNVETVGRVPNVTPWYAAANAVIVPLRAGGGTRIKVLEAFAHQRPVVSTTLGVEGIDGKPEEHFLTADTIEGFARQCRRMMDEPQLRNNLVLNAFRLVRERYCLEAIKKNSNFF